MVASPVQFGAIPPPVPIPIELREREVSALPPSPRPLSDFSISPQPETSTSEKEPQLCPLPDTFVAQLLEPCRGMTEAILIFQHFHGETESERFDALYHVANICALKARKKGAYHKPAPAVRFVSTGAKRNLGSSYRTAPRDWEQYSKWDDALQEKAIRGYFRIALVEYLSKYSPEHITRRELLELLRLARRKTHLPDDDNLRHVCNALVLDMINAGEKQARHEIPAATLIVNSKGVFYYDKTDETLKAATRSQTIRRSFQPDYGAAVRELVKDQHFRKALPKRIRTTLEFVFRRLDAGADGNKVIQEVAHDLNRSERTIHRHLEAARRIATSISTASNDLMQRLSRFVLGYGPGQGRSTPTRPTMAQQEHDTAA